MMRKHATIWLILMGAFTVFLALLFNIIFFLGKTKGISSLAVQYGHYEKALPVAAATLSISFLTA